MINLNSASARLYFTTARLISQVGTGQSVGTGFFFQFSVGDGKFVPCLITNKHVLANMTKLIFNLHEAIDTGGGNLAPATTSFTVTIDKAGLKVIDHPNGVDLCAILTGPINEAAKNVGKTVFEANLDEGMIPTDEGLKGMLGMEEVVMVGYPIGLCDEANNLPVLRRGVTASHPAVNFQGKNWGAVDIGFFQGSSGSPILVWSEGAYVEGNAIKFGNRALLIGVLFGGPVYQVDGTVKIAALPDPIIVAQTTIPIHMGYYIKASEILVLKEHVLKSIGLK